MHPDFARADRLSYAVIGAALEVHSIRGPGLIESIYEKCVMRELELRQLCAVRQEKVEIEYKGYIFERVPPVRCIGGGLPPNRMQGSRKNPPFPQGSTDELYEVVERAFGSDI